jgi:hypothetical protein
MLAVVRQTTPAILLALGNVGSDSGQKKVEFRMQVEALRRNHANQISHPAIGGAFGSRNPDGIR